MKKYSVIFLILSFILTGIPIFPQTKAKSANDSVSATVVSRFGNVEGITAAQLKNYLEFISSDELEGRDTPSRGLDIAALYITNHLKRWGIKPAGDDNTYFQKVPMTNNFIDPSTTRLSLNDQSFKYGNDFLAYDNVPGNISGNLVFAGNGWIIKSKNINQYQGLDVKDKIIVVVPTLPKGTSYLDLQGQPGIDYINAQLYAQAHGAKGIIYVSNLYALETWETNFKDQTEKGLLGFAAKPPVFIPALTISPRVMSVLFKGEKMSAQEILSKAVANEPMDSFALNADKKVSLSVGVRTEQTSAKNVVGIFEGSDPILKNEYVAIGAHYDHIGINPDALGRDKIYNGADDDGSGTVAALALAEAFAKGLQKPKRSILFIWHCGEEKGLWGSEYFSEHPTVPITSITTELNIDMIGRFQQPGDENPVNKLLPKQNEVFVIGSKMMSSELGELSEAVNKSFLNLQFNYKYDDPTDPEKYFYRSDHYNYARKGVPIIFYMDGKHADYHQVTDSLEKIDFLQMEKVARTILATAWELANRPTRVKVDKQIPQ